MEVVSIQNSQVTQCELVLSDKGRLSTAMPGFVSRPQQIELTKAIAQAFFEQKVLIAEAGTGTGKTFAYLIPSLLSGKKVLISTATKTLQDQLFQKDLPNLIRALGMAVRVQNLKGRANYLCHYRTILHSEEGRFNSPQCAHEVLHIREKLPLLTAGERSELPEIAEDSSVWSYVTSTTDNCLGAECDYHQDCFLIKARKKAMDANIVVINHHLFFADSKLKEDGFGEILPDVEAVIFDEAHQLAEIAADFQGERLSTRQLRDLMDDILRECPLVDLMNTPLKKLSIELDGHLESILRAFPKEEEKLDWDLIKNNSPYKNLLQVLSEFCAEVLDCIEIEEKENPGLIRCKERLLSMQLFLQNYHAPKKNSIRWVEKFKQSLAFHSTPLDVEGEFQKLIQRKACAYIFTSATLTMAGSFDYFVKPLGLQQENTLQLTSPFDYKNQALLYLPRGLPDPKHDHFYDALISKVTPVINACGGRCFFLFTSHRALQMVAKRFQHELAFPLLVQGEESKPILLERFRQLGNAVLLGTSTFWEGVDVKGQALSCVIIDKLPFSSPSDPLTRGKLAYLKNLGLSGFEEFSLPQAVLALKQGVGRLIRDENDRGVLMIADPRLTSREYGVRVFASLPLMRKTRTQETVIEFINQLALTHETTSD